MELVYLWVEEYKNIYRQGFTFSPRFECEFDGENLTICDKKEKDNNCKNKNYIENFFGENINVTAIVGENGSGKTNVSEAIISILDTLKNITNNNHNMKLFLVYFDDDLFYKKSINIPNITITPLSHKSDELTESNNQSFTMYFNYTFDILKNEKTEFNHLFHRKDDYETPITMIPNKKDSKIDLSEIDYHTQYSILNFSIRDTIEFKNIKNFFIPYKLKLSININKIINLEELNKLSEFYGNLRNEFQNEDEIKKRIAKAFDDTDTTTEAFVFLPKDAIKTYLKKQKSTLLDNSKLDKFTSEELQTLTKLYLITKLELINFQNTDQQIQEEIAKIIKDDSYFHKKIKEKNGVVTFQNNFKAKMAYDFSKELSSNKFEYTNDYITINKNKNLVKNLPSFITCEIFNENNVSFNSLSYGQKFLMRFVYNLLFQLDKIKDIKIKNSSKNKYIHINLILDEIEQGLHPNWQREFIHLLVEILKTYKDRFVFNIICNSHSPFILSDLPKENVIFLEKYKKDEDKDQKEGNCKNVTKDIDIKTFGANIHTLLSNGFFMSDGLMGEFAKEKIKEILEYLNDTKNKVKLKTIKEEKEQIKAIIESIGEDFLRNKLLNMYNKKYNIKSKDDEIKELKKEIERLKNANNKTK